MSMLQITFKCTALLTIFSYATMQANCCRKTKKYIVVKQDNNLELSGFNNLHPLQQDMTIRRAPMTRSQRAWCILKYTTFSTIIAGVGVGAYFLTTGAQDEVNKIESDLNELKHLLHARDENSNNILNLLAGCPEQLEQYTKLLAKLLANCTG